MPRNARFEIAGVPQHVVQRGNNRSAVFFDDEDRARYLAMARHSAQKHEVAVHAYALMGNHVHLLLTSQEPRRCSGFMHDLESRYVGWFNDRHDRTGSLWEGRYKNCLVDNNSYLWNCYRYIELNPVRAGLVAHPGDYSWSSYAANAKGQPDLLVSPRHEYLVLGNSCESRCQAYRQILLISAASDEQAFARLRGGGVLGSADFEAKVGSSTGGRYPSRPRGRPRKPDEK